MSAVARLRGAGRFVNPLTRPLARRVPPLALVHHRGRRSGRAYRTPVQAYRCGDTWIVMLPFGTDVDWVRNVLAAGGGTLERRGRLINLGTPRLLDGDAALPRIATPARWLMRLVRVGDAIEMTVL